MKSKHNLPPCLRNIIDEMDGGGNPAHFARFALAATLLNVGWEPDEIKQLFVNVFDYDPEVTSYQVDQIARRGYGPPSCSKLQEHNICPVASGEYDSLCRQEWLTSPAKYVRVKDRDDEQRQQ